MTWDTPLQMGGYYNDHKYKYTTNFYGFLYFFKYMHISKPEKQMV